MKQLSLLLIFAFVCSAFAGANDSIGIGKDVGKDSVAVKPNHEISNGDSAKYVKSNAVDSVQKAREAREHEKRKHGIIAAIIWASAGTVIGIFFLLCIGIAASHPLSLGVVGK